MFEQYYKTKHNLHSNESMSNKLEGYMWIIQTEEKRYLTVDIACCMTHVLSFFPPESHRNCYESDGGSGQSYRASHHTQ